MRQRVVVGSGPHQPVLMIVGEAPGRSEDEGGEPFIGRSGQLLFRLIEEEIGISRSDCFVTNVVKCRPPANRSPTRHELETCRPWLVEQFAVVRPSVILAVGNTAARSLFGCASTMAEMHGRVVDLNNVIGVATYHPAAALRGGPSVVGVMRADLKIVKGLVGPS